ncbi:MAG: tetratricopeptide repeat protein [Calditrichaeota bacterium]|nr:MAG: tetratricopeptide repeat protein [Calditrichota bacterium]
MELVNAKIPYEVEKQMIGKTISHYKIVEEIGRGGMGVVYKAEDLRLKRIVAIKFLPHRISGDENERQRFMNEAQTAAALNHPNIATIHDIEEADDEIFIVMEHIDGRELQDIIKYPANQIASQPGAEVDGSHLSMDDINKYALLILAGLQAAHEKGIVHRDIKSSNIMVTDDGQIKIMDFGLAKLVDDTPFVQDDSTVGTAAFMSPEQAQGGAVDQRSDIWAFGVVLYEMISGKLPFQGAYEQAVIYSILNEEPESVANAGRDVPEYYQEIIAKCLQKNVENRYDSASAILRDITRFTATSQSSFEIKKWRELSPHILSKLVFSIVVVLLLVVGLTNFSTVQNWFGFSILPAEKHIIVLPFANISGDDASQAFCDGLIEVLTSQITQFEQFQRSLLVIPASEVRQLGINSASEARKKFNANLAISGSVVRTDESLQLTMNLVDAEKLRQLNSVVLTDEFQGRSNFQDRVVTHLASMLQLNLQPHNKRVLVAGHTTVPGAYDYYIQGRGYLRDFDRLENINMAITLFSRAIEEDSLYALAYSGLGDAYWRKYEETKEVKWIELAQKKCEKAVALNDLLAPVHVTLAILAKGKGQYNLAVTELIRALEIDPVNADAFRELAGTYAKLNKSDKVEETYLKAIELKPGHWENYYELALFYYRKGDYEKAEHQYQFVVKLSPQNYKAVRNLGVIYLLKEQYEKAQIMCERSIAIHPNYGAYANLGLIHFTLNRYEESARMYEKALELNDKYYLNWGNLAISYQMIPAEKDKAKATFLHAIDLAEKQLAINPNNIKCLRSLASYYSALKLFDKTIIYLEKALALAPEDVELMFQAAGRFLEVRDRNKALFYIEKALKNGYSPQKIKQSDSMKSLNKDQDFIALLEKYSRSKNSPH